MPKLTKREFIISKTKIVLQYPYNLDWRFGYLNTNPESRKTLTLYNSPEDRSSTQYARYLLSVSIGRYLTEIEQVDHIDNDKTNNNINNLTIISREDNIRKECSRRKSPLVVIRCPVCKLSFKRRKSNTQLIPSLKGKVTCCSRGCAHQFISYRIEEELKLLISEESVL